MFTPRQYLPVPGTRLEATAVTLMAWVAFVVIPLSLGGIGLSWDALNHHVYLGWIADHPRFDKDYLAASTQSFQYPYLYWPFFKLFQAGIPGRWAGAVLVTLNLPAVPALWLLARRMVPEASWYGVAMRTLAVALAFMTGVVLSMFDSTAGDLYAAIPLVWAVALAIEALQAERTRPLPTLALVVLSGFFAGMAVAFKLSNGPLAALMPLLWILAPGPAPRRFLHVACAGAAALAGVALFYGYWGWQLWAHYGNPVYPFAEGLFSPLRHGTGRP